MRPRRSNLCLRLASAGVGLPILAALAWVGSWPFAVLAAAAAFVAALEFLRGWLLPDRSLLAAARLWAVPAAAAATVLLSHREPRTVALGGLLALACASVGYAPLSRRLEPFPYRVFSWCLAYTGVMLSTAVLLRDLPGGRDWLFLALLATFATDTAAYGTGRLWGRRALAPAISPAKTIEGAVGGFAGGALAVLALAALLSVEGGLPEVLLIGLFLPIGAQLGDIGESWMKRQMGIKDSSALLPGHGGVLDRLDSLVVTVALTYLIVRLLVV